MLSASSWGCELKCLYIVHERNLSSRQPLREAVSWNITCEEADELFRSQPLREAVSWNSCSISEKEKLIRQPLREAVSWNVNCNVIICFRIYVSLFVRLWVEIQGSAPVSGSWTVSLFVRLWVEMLQMSWKKLMSSCQPLREAVSWNAWPADTILEITGQPLREAVSWNMLWTLTRSPGTCQPLREAVSWNVHIRWRTGPSPVSLFVRLWVEIVITSSPPIYRECQPLREAVSWNIRPATKQKRLYRQPLREAVSWNVIRAFLRRDQAVSLFVRLWVEMR